MAYPHRGFPTNYRVPSGPASPGSTSMTEPDCGPWDPETPPTRTNVLLSAPCADCGGTGAENGVTGKGACSTCRGTGQRWPKANPEDPTAGGYAIPDRIAIDANGYGWRVWDGYDSWSMVPTNSNNDPVPEPVTWFVPEVAPLANLGADVAAVAERLDEAATRHTVKVQATGLPEAKALAARSDLLDRIHDEAFPNDPYMLGRLHAEMERLGYGKDET